MISRFLSCLLGCACIAGAAEPPNVILVLSDDQGYGELSCHGNPVVRTPHLDALHAQSVRFTDFHVAPMCTPTRGQLMTGWDAVRHGALNVSSGRTLLRREAATLPELLGAVGYATGLFGKWHLGDNYPYRPQDRGFSEVLTFPSSHIGSVPDAWLNDYFDDTYVQGGQPKAFQGYTTDVFFTEAMAWMRRQKTAGKPFFAYLATAAPHSPHYVPDHYREAVRKRFEAVAERLPPLSAEDRASLISYLAMIENLDENIGRLESFLSRENLRDNTVLIFLSDNGTTLGDKYFPCGMRGKKVTLWEGGHRVPLFIRWPRGGLGPARDVDVLTQVQDLFPTVLELARVEKPEWPFLDGTSLAPLMRGLVSQLPDRALFINYSRMPVAQPMADGTVRTQSAEVTMEGTAVLWKQWRWLEDARLYDVKADPMQQQDVAAQHPAVVAELRQRLRAWWQRSGGKANQPQSVIIGHDAENPSLLTACEWWDVFVDQQSQVRRGELKSGRIHVEVATSGTYEWELRRWPRDAALALRDPAPAAKLTDGHLPPGKALPIARARLEVGAQVLEADVAPEAQHVSFRTDLTPGKTTVQATFCTADGTPLVGAYYVHVRRL